MRPFSRSCEPLLVMAPDAPSSGDGRSTTVPMTVPLTRIVGTIARCCDFDRCFRPLRPHLRRRLARLRTVLGDRYLPAVRLRQFGDSFYVVDGHHRLALARERGMPAMDAIVTCTC